MRLPLWGMSVLLGTGVGALLPTWTDATNPIAARPAVPYQAEGGSGPALAGSGTRLRTAPAPDAGAKPRAPTRPTRIVLQDSPLESPDREWAQVERAEGLTADARRARMLVLAENFSMRRHFDHAARTLDRIDERVSDFEAFKARVRLARAWNEHRRGEEAQGLALAEAVAIDEHASASIRAQGAYASVLMAFGLGETERARTALARLDATATVAEASMRRDAHERFGALLASEEPR